MLGIGALATVGLLATLAIGRPEPIVATLALLGAAYALILVVDEPPLDGRSAIVGAALLAIGELAHLSVEARLAVTEEAGAAARRVASVAALTLLALALGGAVLAAVDLLRIGGIAVEVVGVAAAVGAVGLLVLAARAHRETGIPQVKRPGGRISDRDVWDEGSSQASAGSQFPIGNPLARIPDRDDR